MSTYYYLVCDDHQEKTDAASRTAGGYCPLVDSAETLIPFVIAHCGCNIRILNEHTEDDDPAEGYREWTAETVRSEIQNANADDRWR